MHRRGPIKRSQRNLVAAVKERSLVQQVRRIRLRQLDHRRERRVVHCRAHGGIGAISPQRREVVLSQRVVKVVPHQLVFAVDGVVDTHDVLANLGRLGNRGDVLCAVVEVRLGERARVQLENGILVNQVGWDYIAGERLPGC